MVGTPPDACASARFAHPTVLRASYPRRSPPLHGAPPRRARQPWMQPARSLTPRLGRCLRSACKLDQHPQGLDDRALTHRTAADGAEAAFAMQDSPVTRGHREMYEADRLAGCRTARTRDAGDRDGEIDAGLFQRADRHRGRGFLADRAETVERGGFDAQH